MAWRVCKAILKLFAQINALAPRRSKASDGTIGDAAHQATDSDHNPDRDGTVDAGDFTHDPGGGADMHVIGEALRLSRDRRIKYVIFYDRYFSPQTGWQWRKYTGSNNHRKHMHVSVMDEFQDDTSEWGIAMSLTSGQAAQLTGIATHVEALAGRVLAIHNLEETGTWGPNDGKAVPIARAITAIGRRSMVLTAEDRAAIVAGVVDELRGELLDVARAGAAAALEAVRINVADPVTPAE